MQSFEDFDVENQGRRLERFEATLLPDPEPEELWCPMISADDHVLEPPDMFEGRMPARLVESAPRIVEDEDGVPFWCYEDKRLMISFNNGASGRPMSDSTMAPQKFDEFRPGVWDVHRRVADMDLNGIYGSLCFASIVFGFAGTRFFRMDDPELGLACLRAYNDWMIDEWCGAYPDRFIPCQITWMPDPEVAAREVRANAERGFKAVSFSENPEANGFTHLYSDHWDPFFRACEETGTVINLHVGSSGAISRPSSHSPGDASVTLFPVNGLQAIVDWIFAKVPARFPDLKIALSEAGVSWVPMIIERLGRSYRQRESSTWWTDTDPHPVDLLHRNFWFTSIEDTSAYHQLDIIGEDKVMSEADYPHSDSSWPSTQSLFRRDLVHLADSTIKKICYENAARLYRHPEPPAELLAASVIGQPDTRSLAPV